MRIGIVTDNYFPSVGGTEISIWNYTKSLEEQGHEVFVFCPNFGAKNPKHPKKSSVRIRSIRGLYKDHPLLFVYPGITKVFRKYNLDILHSQTPITSVYVAEHISKKLGIPHIHTMHTLIPEQVKRSRTGLLKFSLLYFIQSIILRTFRIPKNYLLQDEARTLSIKVRLSWIYMLRLVSVPDAVIFPSKHVKAIFKARGYTNKSFLLPTFSSMFMQDIKKTRSGPNEDEVRIITVGRLDIEKRPQVVIDAVNLLPNHLRWKLLIIGSGNQERKLMQLARKYGIEEKVIFKGTRRQSEIASELMNADIFVMPSYRFDTQGIVLLEACEAGLPIVYCDNNLSVGVNTSNSVLTLPYAMSMADGIQKLIEDPELRGALAEGSLEISKKYQPDKLTKKLTKIYSDVIADYSSS